MRDNVYIRDIEKVIVIALRGVTIEILIDISTKEEWRSPIVSDNAFVSTQYHDAYHDEDDTTKNRDTSKYTPIEFIKVPEGLWS